VSILNPLYQAVAWVMAQIHAGLSLFLPSTSGGAWFLTIVLLVVLMRLLLVPLFVKQMHSMRKMSALTPQLQELRKKYKGDKQTLNEETMRLYKEAGVNPLGGCLPLVAQLPVFFALFSVLRGIADWKSGPTPYGLSESVVKSAQNANILGAHISDKVLFTGTMHVPLEAKIVILCFVAISVTTTFMTVRQSTKRGMTPAMTPDNPMAASQKYMAYIVPFFALSGLYWAFGLVLYWVTTNVWTLGQQWVLFKRYPPTPATATAGTTSSPGVSPKPATSAGLVSGNSNKVVRRPAAPRPAADAAKRPAPAKPAAAKSTEAKPAAAKPASAGAAPASGAKPAANAKPAAGTRPATGTKPAAGTKPAGAAKPAPAKSAPAKSSASSGQPQSKKPAGNAAAAGGSAQRKPQQSRPAAQERSGNGSASVSGILRRFGRGREEAEEQPETPDVKLVRQQRVRQSRSKRSGKR
jgi:YidC/Oxa1 family membrane protein insertase